jgi:hypothetical protein
MRQHLSVATFVATLALIGCPTEPQVDPDPAQGSDMATLALAFSDLDELNANFVYEGWLIVDGAPVSTGRFHAADAADLDQLCHISDAEAATAYVLTIEPEPDMDDGPSAVHVLGGDLMSGSATLSSAHGAALGVDLDAVGGAYILETPTSTAADDYDQGIWWLDASSGAPMAALDLPALPMGWTYEGWVVVDGTPISTGTFDAGDMADSDGAGSTAGPGGAPPFPGQDFVDPATVLIDGAAVISVEPVPDTSSAPFAIKPLIDGMIEDIGAGMTQTMDDGAPLPAGTLTVQ